MSLKSQKEEKVSVVKMEEQEPYQVPNELKVPSQEDMQEFLVRLRTLEAYIGTMLKEGMQREIAITTELEQISEVSQRLQKEMTLTLKHSIENLQSVNEDYKKDISESITAMNTLLKQVAIVVENNKETVVSDLQTNRNLIEKRLNEIKTNNEKHLRGMSQETKTLISNARNGILINNLLDVVKYGFGSLIFNVPVLAALYYFFVY